MVLLLRLSAAITYRHIRRWDFLEYHAKPKNWKDTYSERLQLRALQKLEQEKVDDETRLMVAQLEGGGGGIDDDDSPIGRSSKKKGK